MAIDSSSWFDDLPVIGRLPADKAAQTLRDMGDPETADLLEEAEQPSEPLETFGAFGLFKPKAFQHTAHTFGYVAPFEAGETALVEIQHAGNIAPHQDLKEARIAISLNELRVADYPGSGMHHVLFDFYGQNQTADDTAEHVHFTQTYRAQEGESVGVIGYPIFVGLRVGGQGAAFRCFTVNVKNDADEGVLKFLDSDVFKAGLKLVQTVQPAIAPLTGLAQGVTRMVASRNKNVAVQDFSMGLDFGGAPGSARLAEGMYVAVQIPEKDSLIWDWAEWAYRPTGGRVVSRSDETTLIPYNYVSFGVRRYTE